MAGMMEAIKEYLRSCHGAVRASLAYAIRKTITAQTYCDYPTNATFEDEMIARMLHLPPERNKLLFEHDDKSVRAHMVKHQIDKRNVYDILDQICKDTDLYPYVKQHKSKSDRRVAFYAIHCR